MPAKDQIFSKKKKRGKGHSYKNAKVFMSYLNSIKYIDKYHSPHIYEDFGQLQENKNLTNNF